MLCCCCFAEELPDVFGLELTALCQQREEVLVVALCLWVPHVGSVPGGA